MTRLANPKKILVIPLRYIGDTILSIPLIRQLYQNFPTAQIHVLASATAAPLLTPCPYITQVKLEPKGLIKTCAFLKEGQYDAVFLLRKSFTMALVCKLAGIPVVVGYDKQRFPFGFKRWGLFLDAKANYPSRKNPQTPQALSHLSLLNQVGLTASDHYLELWGMPEDESGLTQILAASGLNPDCPIAAIHALSASSGKSIAPTTFLPAIQHLLAQGVQVVFTGTQADRNSYEALKSRYPELVTCVNLAGLTHLRQTFLLYQRIQLLLTVDSSPLHLGTAAGVPKIIGVFGPTSPVQWGPYPGANRDSQIAFTPVALNEGDLEQTAANILAALPAQLEIATPLRAWQ